MGAPFRGSEDYTTSITVTKKGKEKKGSLHYHQILTWLQQKPCFAANIFDYVVFEPTTGTPEHKDGKFNLSTGFKVQPTDCKEDDPDMKLVLNHLHEVIANGNDAMYQYILNWFAHCFQHPNRKIGTMLVLIGGQEAGKNILLDWIGEMIYGNMYCMLSSLETLTQRFNAYQNGKLFMVLNEIQSYGGSFRDADKLKTIITERERLIEPKGKEAYRLNCYENYILISNNDWTVCVDADDRRYPCIRVSDKYRGDKPYFDRLGAVLTAGTAAKFMGLMMARNITEWRPTAIPTTELRTDMKMMSLS
ncbi:MAG: primase-helicase family protein, partial [Candidatus Saccharimonadales bacterium]